MGRALHAVRSTNNEDVEGRQAMRFSPPRPAFLVILGLPFALVFAGATTSAVVITAMTLMDAVESEGSLETFEARIRHYSDRLDSDEHGIRYVRADHPFLQHFGLIALCWVVAIGSGAAVCYLKRQITA